MAEKYPQEVQGYPLAPPTMLRSDQESSTNYQSEASMKRKKRMRCLASIAIFAILQTAIILVIVLAVARISTPRVRLHNVVITNGVNGNVRFMARVSVRNRNFGRYKFDSSVATIMSGERNVGQLVIPDGRVRFRSTRRVLVIGNFDSSGNSSGMLSLTVSARLRGEVEFVRVIERRRPAYLTCTMNVNLSNNVVRDLRCL